MVCALRVLLLAQCSGAAARRPLPTRHTEAVETAVDDSAAASEAWKEWPIYTDV